MDYISQQEYATTKHRTQAQFISIKDALPLICLLSIHNQYSMMKYNSSLWISHIICKHKDKFSNISI